jgi:hypothetical protein
MVNSLSPLLARTTIISATKSISSCDTGEAFVDDTSLGCTTLIPYEDSVDRYLPKSEGNIVENLQLLGQQWEHLLFATGSALCVEKSFFVHDVMALEQSRKCQTKNIQQSLGIMQLTSGSDTINNITVPRIEAMDTFRT